MGLEVFAEQEGSELSMTKVVRAILEERGRNHGMYFSDLVNEIQSHLEKSDTGIRETLPYPYSALNVDGSFIPLEDNRWGLHSWYTIDEINKKVITLEEDENGASKRKPKHVNAFMDGNEDIIDYPDDDPGDEGFTPESSDLEYDEENPDDEKSGVESYDSETNEIVPDEDLDEEVNISGEDDEDDDLDEE